MFVFVLLFFVCLLFCAQAIFVLILKYFIFVRASGTSLIFFDPLSLCNAHKFDYFLHKSSQAGTSN